MIYLKLTIPCLILMTCHLIHYLSVIHPDHPNELVDFISSYLPMTYGEKVEIIESIDIYHRLEQVKQCLNKLLIDGEVNQQLDGLIQQNVDMNVKKMMLKAKLRAIPNRTKRHNFN